jgi:undecaprenyl-diphosphatase
LLEKIREVDFATFAWCHRKPADSPLFSAARKISRSADGWLYLALPLAYILYASPSALRFATLSAWVFAAERSVYFVLKNTCRRRRPPEVLPGFRSLVVASDRFSFPSGHTSAAFLFAGLCSLEFGAWAAVILYPWAACVGASRVLLGVHFPSDTVAGALLGSCLLASLPVSMLA